MNGEFARLGQQQQIVTIAYGIYRALLESIDLYIDRFQAVDDSIHRRLFDAGCMVDDQTQCTWKRLAEHPLFVQIDAIRSLHTIAGPALGHRSRKLTRKLSYSVRAQ